MAPLVLSIATLATLTVLIAMIWKVGGGLLRMNARQEPLPDPTDAKQAVSDLAKVVWGHGQELDRLKLALSDGIERVDRANKRIEKTVANARRLVAASGLEHPGLEAEAEQLRLADGEPSGPEPVPAMPESLDLPSGRPTGIPGVSFEDLQRLQEESIDA